MPSFQIYFLQHLILCYLPPIFQKCYRSPDFILTGLINVQESLVDSELVLKERSRHTELLRSCSQRNTVLTEGLDELQGGCSASTIKSSFCIVIKPSWNRSKRTEVEPFLGASLGFYLYTKGRTGLAASWTPVLNYTINVKCQ